MTINAADAKFGACLVGGLPSADEQTINSMALLFERIYVPFNSTVMRGIIKKSVEDLRGVKAIETRFFYADFEKPDLRMKDNSPFPIQQIANLQSYIGSGTGQTEEEAINELFHRAAITLAVVMYFYEQAMSY